MKETELRDLISLNINKLKPGLTLLQKEQYIPNELGTKGFIDLYVKDEFGHHVLIEIKRSKAASREALHEVNKYVEGIKQHFGAKNAEIHTIIASTEWSELLVPFSRFVDDATFSLQGYEIVATDDGADFHVNLVDPLPVTQGRFIAPWQNIYWYETANTLERGIHSIQKAYKEKQIDDYVIVKFHYRNELAAEDRATVVRSAIAQMTGIDEVDVSLPSEMPLHEYIVYTGLQLLTKERCLQILSRNADITEEIQELLLHLEEDELLCHLHEYVEAMKPNPQNDYYEIGYPAKFAKLLDSPNSKILAIIRHGSFARNTLLSDETIISELRGEDGSTGQRFKKKVSVNNASHIKTLKSELASCLSENPVWKAHIFRIIEEIQVEFPDSEIDISIFNPCTGVFTIYYATTMEYGLLYIPSYHIIVHDLSNSRTYFGALEKTGKALTFPQILAKYYEGNLDALLFSRTWGGKDLRDSDIIEDLGAQYRSFCCDTTEVGHTFFKLRDDKWRACEAIDMLTLFSEYLKDHKKLVHQIITKIHRRNNGAFFSAGSSTLLLDELVDLELAKKKNRYFQGAPNECDHCRCSFENEKYMIDGKLQGCSTWACLCADCFEYCGEGIAVGQGQLYLHTPDGWLLVGGAATDSEVENF